MNVQDLVIKKCSRNTIRLMIFGALILPLCTVAPFFLTDRVVLNYMDMYLYLDIVRDMANGDYRLFATPTRTNLFPLLLHGWFEVLGYDLVNLRWFYCICLALIGIQTWLIGWLLFGNCSGLIAALLVITSYTFGHFIYFPHIDLVLLLFINFCLILLKIAFNSEKNGFGIFIMSGLAIGVAFLIKEAAIWLLFFIPVYSFLTKVKIRQICKTWSGQILPFLIPAGMILVFSGKNFIIRYSNRINKIILAMSGDNGLIAHHNSGWYAQGLDHLSPPIKLVFFLFLPIYWQWDQQLPVPKVLICLEQLTIVGSFLFFLIFVRNQKLAKIFIIAVLILYLPRFLYVAVAGSKMRQILPFFYILYLPLGQLCYLWLMRFNDFFTQYFGVLKARISVVIVVLAVVSIRFGLFFNGIDYTLNSADVYYQRPNPMIDMSR